MAANFNNSAWFYDRLSRLVYGKTLVEAQVYLLQFVPANAKVLIVGGGTGWIMEELAKIHPQDLQITYVEIAPAMMALSKKRNTGDNEVLFINQAIEEVNFPQDFDIALTPFLFDNFTEANFQKIFRHIHATLKPGSLWLNCDFQLTGKWWQYILLKTMFAFFRLTCHIEARQLPQIKRQFSNAGYRQTAHQTFFGDFITSEVYETVRTT
jgi:ubiquinone/menaquinone biosynthesis C-methylase UbiE